MSYYLRKADHPIGRNCPCRPTNGSSHEDRDALDDAPSAGTAGRPDRAIDGDRHPDDLRHHHGLSNRQRQLQPQRRPHRPNAVLQRVSLRRLQLAGRRPADRHGVPSRFRRRRPERRRAPGRQTIADGPQRPTADGPDAQPGPAVRRRRRQPQRGHRRERRQQQHRLVRDARPGCGGPRSGTGSVAGVAGDAAGVGNADGRGLAANGRLRGRHRLQLGAAGPAAVSPASPTWKGASWPGKSSPRPINSPASIPATWWTSTSSATVAAPTLSARRCKTWSAPPIRRCGADTCR